MFLELWTKIPLGFWSGEMSLGVLGLIGLLGVLLFLLCVALTQRRRYTGPLKVVII